MTTLNKYIEHIEKYVCVCTFTVMLGLTFINVISRFVLHMSLSFSEEIVTSLFVLASLAGTSMAIRDGSHLGLDYITSFMSKSVQRFLAIVANVLGVLMCCIILYYGIHMVIDEFVSNQLSATMQWPEWIYGMSVPIGASMLIFRYCYAIFLLSRGQSGVAAHAEATR
ncbi:MAG: TRAP transporter small permease [Deltaproteobacteria bacterium]|nr:TRAP transporter small permease [Deltaproteobacteria bacterium]